MFILCEIHCYICPQFFEYNNSVLAIVAVQHQLKKKRKKNDAPCSCLNPQLINNATFLFEPMSHLRNSPVYTLYIRTVRFQCLSPALLNWLKQFMDIFCRATCTVHLISTRKESNVPKVNDHLICNHFSRKVQKSGSRNLV